MVNHWFLGVYHRRIYANIGQFVSQNIPHCTPLAVKHTFCRYLSLTKHKYRLPPIVWNKCPFFSPFHTPINTCVDLPRLPSSVYSLCTMLPCFIRKIYSSPTCPCASKHFLGCIHLNVSLLRGVCQHALTKLAISRQLFHVASWFHTLSMHIELQNTIVYGSSLIERTGGAHEQWAKTYGIVFVCKSFASIIIKENLIIFSRDYWEKFWSIGKS